MLEGRHIWVEVDHLGSEDGEVACDGLLHLHGHIHHRLLVVVKDEVIWRVCLISVRVDSLGLHVWQPPSDHRVVTCPVGTLHHANGVRERLLNLVVELVGWPEVQVAVEDGGDYLDHSRWRTLLRDATNLGKGIKEQG